MSDKSTYIPNKRLEKAIQDRGLSRQEAAYFLGIPPTTLRDWLRGDQPKVQAALGAIVKIEPNWRKRAEQAERERDELKTENKRLQIEIARINDGCKGSLQIGGYSVEWDGVDDLKVTTPYRLSYHICGGDFQGLLSAISDVRRIPYKKEAGE